MGLETTPNDEKNVVIPEGNMTVEEWEEALNLPQNSDWMNEVELDDLPKDCKALNGKIDIGEKCPILKDAVGQMVGEVSDHYDRISEQLEKATDFCKSTRKKLTG